MTHEVVGSMREHRELPETTVLPDRERGDRRRETGEHCTRELEASPVREREHGPGQKERARRLDRDRRPGRHTGRDAVEQ